MKKILGQQGLYEYVVLENDFRKISDNQDYLFKSINFIGGAPRQKDAGIRNIKRGILEEKD